ncbi:hypothetical protein [Methylomonas sp. UP202]|uniref:hypothetical protein n=1 Tax=Methylomonas sp. UP202 TaxID=3040943 RepID=UPI0024788DDA|nr:hypothetical protein [Methylomonas sp. UP202]WGS84967.1 hypothetical protein QC632_18205 [Methylomonas sp. UP202]
MIAKSRYLLYLSVGLFLNNTSYAARLTEPGISVSGNGTHWFKVCSTCPDDGSSASDSKGGNGYPTATTEFNDIYSWFAEGSLTGAQSLPILKAYAKTDVPNTIGYVSATATAQGLQAYHYAGTESQTYTITFSVSGLLSGDTTESITAGMNVWGGIFDPYAELPGSMLGGDFVNAHADPLVNSTALNESRAISFDLAPGQDFFITSYITASAFWADGSDIAGTADAAHSMTAQFTAGDSTMLNTLTTSVPLPPSAWLLLSGIAFLTFSPNKNRKDSKI